MRSLFFVLFILGACAAQAANFTAKANGNWNASFTWQNTGGTADLDGIPDLDDIVTMNGFTVFVTDNRACASIILNGTTSASTLIIQPGVSLTIPGTFNSTNTSTNAVTVTVLGTLTIGSTTTLSGSNATRGNVTFNIGDGTSSGAVTITGALTMNRPTGSTNTTKVNLFHGNFDINGDITATGSTTPVLNTINTVDTNSCNLKPKRIYWSGTIIANSLNKLSFTVNDPDANIDYIFTFDGAKDQMFPVSNTNYTFKDVQIKNAGFRTWLPANLNQATLIKGVISVFNDCIFSDSARTVSLNADAIEIQSGGTYRRVNASSYSMSTINLSASSSIFEFYSSSGTQDVLTVAGDYHIVKLSGPGIKRLQANIDNITNSVGSITVTQGTFQYGNGTTIPSVILSTNPGQTHTIKLESNTTLLIPVALTLLPDAFFDLDVNSTVQYSLNGAQRIYELPDNIGGVMSYGNITLSGTTATSKKTINSFDTIEVRNTVQIGGLNASNLRDSADLIISSSACLSLLSTADYTGTIDSLGSRNTITYQGSGATAGTIICRRYITLPDVNFRDYCSPIQKSTLLSLQNCGLFMTGLAGSSYPPPFYSYVNAYYYDETANGTLNNGWYAASSITDSLTKTLANGRIVRSAWRVYGGDYDQSVLTLQDVGQIRSGNQVHALTFNYYTNRQNDDGWNLIGNPFPRPLDWDKICADGTNRIFDNSSYTDGVMPTFYIWRPYQNGNNTDEYKNYGYYNYLTGVSDSLEGPIISPFQGFFVKTYHPNQNPVTYNLTIKEKHKASSGASTFYKSSRPKPQVVTINVSTSNGADRVSFHEFENATPGQDPGFDIVKFRATGNADNYEEHQSPISINFMEGDSVLDLIVNAVPSGISSFSLPLYLKDDEAGVHRLWFGNLQPFLEAYSCVSVYDILENKWFDLKESASIQFSNEAGYEGNRFTIFFQNELQPSTVDATCSDTKDGLLSADFKYKASRKLELYRNDVFVSNHSGTISRIKESLLPGSYTLIDRAGNPSCKVCTTTFVINSAPEITISVNTFSPEVLVGVPVKFINNSTGGDSFNWTFFEDNSTSTDENPSFTFKSVGTKLVKLEVNSVNLHCNKSKVFEYSASESAGLTKDLGEIEDFSVNLDNGLLLIQSMKNDIFQLIVRTLDGKLVFDGNTSSGIITVSLANVNGPVIVSINSQGKWIHKKLYN